MTNTDRATYGNPGGSDTDRDAYAHLGGPVQIPNLTQTVTLALTADQCYANAAQCLTDGAKMEGGYATSRAELADRWLMLADQLRARVPGDPITPAAIAHSGPDALHTLARNYPHAFALAVHQLVTDTNAELEELRARSLTHKAQSETATAEQRAAAKRADGYAELLHTRNEALRRERERAQSLTERCQQAEHDLDHARDDARRYKADYERTCKTIADMHAAAFGGEVRGPERGVVEDIADLYSRCQAAEEALANALRTNDELRAEQERTVSTSLQDLRLAAKSIADAHQQRTKDLAAVAEMAETEAEAAKGVTGKLIARYVRIAVEHLSAGHEGRPQSCADCAPRAKQATAEAGEPLPIGRLRAYIAEHYPQFATGQPIALSTIDLLRTLDARHRALVNGVKTLLDTTDHVARRLRDGKTARSLTDAVRQMRELLAQPAPATGETVPHGVPPVGSPTTIADLHNHLHVTPDPEQVWTLRQQSIRKAARQAVQEYIREERGRL